MKSNPMKIEFGKYLGPIPESKDMGKVLEIHPNVGDHIEISVEEFPPIDVPRRMGQGFSNRDGLEIGRPIVVGISINVPCQEP